ncbi:MAG: ChbG/HpnK family deacetylase [Planctomycetes bacterium]|nr:ChbG/HpnK family deacetylase [Planctomycetota bacterium]
MILVANADDAGIDVPRNDGILRAAERGIVRSASLLVTAPAAEDFARRARETPDLGVGLHWNLTEGAPLAGRLPSLTGEDGRFLPKRELARRAGRGILEPREAERELEAQWARAEALGIRPTHLDGHNHAHLFPGIAEAAVRVLPEGTWVRGRLPAVDAVRGSSAALLWPEDPYADRDSRARWIEALTARALGLGWTRFRMAARFEGLSLAPGFGAGELIALLASIRCAAEDVVELMTHPGEPAAGSVPFSASPDRRLELEALVDRRVAAFVREQGIRLASFGDLP